MHAPLQEPGLLEQAGLLWAELRGLAHDQFHLLAVELRQARSHFVVMIGLALAAAALFATSWLGLVAAAVIWMIERGTSPVSALLAAVGVNLAVAVVCVLFLYGRGRDVPFAATLRSIRGR